MSPYIFTNPQTGFTLDSKIGSTDMVCVVDNNTVQSWGIPTPTDSQKWTVTTEGLIKNQEGKALTFEAPNRVTFQPVKGNSDDKTQQWSVSGNGVLKCDFNDCALVVQHPAQGFYYNVVCEKIDESNPQPNQCWNIPPEAANILNQHTAPPPAPPPPPPPPNPEIEQCRSMINELRLYKQRYWAIGLNGDTLQPDGFVAFFSQRNLPFEYFVRSRGVSRGDYSAYDRNIATLENYIKTL